MYCENKYLMYDTGELSFVKCLIKGLFIEAKWLRLWAHDQDAKRNKKSI